MKNSWSIFLGALISMPVFGQSADVSIEKQEAACYSKFAVNDCLNKVHAQQREARGEQRRREIELKDAERKEKSQQKLERLKEKSSESG